VIAAAFLFWIGLFFFFYALVYVGTRD